MNTVTILIQEVPGPEGVSRVTIDVTETDEQTDRSVARDIAVEMISLFQAQLDPIPPATAAALGLKGH